MRFFRFKSDDTADRLRIRYALRHLVEADREFMDGIDECDYCHSTPGGHAPGCVFSSAVDVVFAEKLPTREELRRALGDLLLADNYLLGTTEYICPYCDEVGTHTADCVYRTAIEIYTRKTI